MIFFVFDKHKNNIRFVNFEQVKKNYSFADFGQVSWMTFNL